jgi:hypothetical protein
MEKLERRMEDFDMCGREGSEGRGAVECFLRHHTEKKTQHVWSTVAKAETS